MFRDCNGESNGQELPAETIAAEAICSGEALPDDLPGYEEPELPGYEEPELPGYEEPVYDEYEEYEEPVYEEYEEYEEPVYEEYEEALPGYEEPLEAYEPVAQTTPPPPHPST